VLRGDPCRHFLGSPLLEHGEVFTQELGLHTTGLWHCFPAPHPPCCSDVVGGGWEPSSPLVTFGIDPSSVNGLLLFLIVEEVRTFSLFRTFYMPL
jgi:hypothetical protein